MENNNSQSSGVGCFTVIGIVLIILKLTDNIDWSWWLVLAPIWIPLVLIVLFFIIVTILDNLT